MDPRIVTDPAVMTGKPRIAGTRITVEHLVAEPAAAGSGRQLVDDYPRLQRDDIRAALRFATETASESPSGSVRPERGG